MGGWYRTAYGLEIQKDPDSTRDYSLSWVDQLSAGVTISSVTHVMPSGINKTAEGVNGAAITDRYGRVHPIGTVTHVRVTGGAVSGRYQVIARGTFSSGEVDDRVFYVNVVESL